MFRRIDDFEKQWQVEHAQTMRVLRAMTDASLEQAIVPGGRTLGRLAWHLTQALQQMPARAGLAGEDFALEATVPASAVALADAYERTSQRVLDEVRRHWDDAALEEERNLFGEPWTNGFTLEVLIRHQAHHRGQMTVLMRQAGLAVPGVYGPAREEWAAWGMEAQQ